LCRRPGPRSKHLSPFPSPAPLGSISLTIILANGIGSEKNSKSEIRKKSQTGGNRENRDLVSASLFPLLSSVPLFWLRTLDKRLVKSRVCLGEGVNRESLLGAVTAGFTHLPAAVRIIQDQAGLLGHVHLISRLNQKPVFRVLDNLRQSRQARSHHRLAGRHRFQRHVESTRLETRHPNHFRAGENPSIIRQR